jgi:hypothetical protein
LAFLGIRNKDRDDKGAKRKENIPNGRFIPRDKEAAGLLSESGILEGQIKGVIKDQKKKYISHIHSRTMYEVVFL